MPASVGSLAVAAVVTSLSTSARAQESAEVEAILKRGIQLRREGQDEAALAVFKEAETLAPNSVRVLLHVATAAQAASKAVPSRKVIKVVRMVASSARIIPQRAGRVRGRDQIRQGRSVPAGGTGAFTLSPR